MQHEFDYFYIMNSEKNEKDCSQRKIGRYWTVILGLLLGLAGGYIYFLQTGCTTGACPLKANPVFPLLWGGTFGMLIGSFFVKKNKSDS
ncbi:MAG: hypothetical protein V2A54_00970 [Bacteroidota bacterium]